MMARISWRLDSGMHSRFEYKYLVDPRCIDDIREYFLDFVRPDPFAERNGNRAVPYRICSLYLDSPDFRLFQQTQGGEKNRFKMRIRTYNDDPSTPAFLEVKKRENVIVMKTRAAVSRQAAAALLAGRTLTWPTALPEELAAAVDCFETYRSLIEAVPVMKVRYRREAYVSYEGDPVRVTIDTNLMHCVTLEPDLSHEKGHWTPTRFSGTIFEVKFTERFPYWAEDLIRMFGLRNQSVPKYVASVDQAGLVRCLRDPSVAGFASSAVEDQRARLGLAAWDTGRYPAIDPEDLDE